MARVIKYNNLTNTNIDNFKFGEPKVNQRGGKSCYVSYQNSQLYLQTPKNVHVPYGINRSTYDDKNSRDGKPNIDVSKGIDNEDIAKFFEVIENIENRVKKEFKRNSMSWMKKKSPSDETIDELFSSSIRKSIDRETQEPNGKYPDTFKFKINEKETDGNKVIVTRFFDSKRPKPGEVKQTLTTEEVLKLTQHGGLKGYNVKLIIRLQGVWISSDSFGCSWVAEQVKVYENNVKKNEYKFKEDSEPEDNDDSSDSSDSDESDSDDSDSDDSDQSSITE